MLQNSQENTCVRVSFLIKLQALILKLIFCTEHLQATAFRARVLAGAA